MVVIAAFSVGESAIRRAISVNVCVRSARSWSTCAPVAMISRSSVRSASFVTVTLTSEIATAMHSTASSALARKIRLRSDDSIFIAA